MDELRRTADAVVTIDSPPGRVYELISDVTRMGEWSPETTSCRWLAGATGATVGARFLGVNRAGWRRWATFCRVTEAEPGRCFAFDVSLARVPVATWRYDIEPDGSRCVVRESWTDRRPGWVRAVYPYVMGVRDRATHNERDMATTLAALKRAAETVPATGT